MGLEAFMKDLHKAAIEPSDPPAEIAEATAEPSTELEMSDLPTHETPAVDLGNSILGKRKASSPVAIAEPGVGADIEAEKIEEKSPKHAKLTSSGVESEEPEEEQEDLGEFHDALAGDEMMVDGNESGEAGEEMFTGDAEEPADQAE
ncbi:hypothetical protein B0A54_14022 [Friedmanniomyces endolithicus]|uniref:Uncharacterized protein n=1 Tax=Friedmanniomyces endolithicus TaxID=329885 RepID=A0A4V5N823_9PEZI|nr:hypothetical protein LTS09_006445 [Friedmanniomyces endolithicus]TKA34809.1 hypothetical protein B0A54_14022 [Friedmanniomyces endolithicus]